jgi:hypothetical protein
MGSAGRMAPRFRRTRIRPSFLNGNYGWHMDGAGAPPVAAPPQTSALATRDVDDTDWLHQGGPAAWSESESHLAMGARRSRRDPSTTIPEKTYNISININGKVRWMRR